MRRIFNLVISFVLSLFMAIGYTPAAVHAEETEESTGDIVILYTNDVHCAIDGYSAFAGLKQQLADEGNSVLLVDAGDAIQGEIIGLMTTGEAIVNLMNAAGYDYAALGNHEFDYKVPRILELTEKAEYKYLSANFMDLATGAPYYDGFDVVELAGHKVGIVGIATPETYTKSTPTYFMNEEGEFIYSFGENDLYGYVQKAVDGAKAAGAEVVIALGHTGMDGTTEEWNTESIIRNTSGIDYYIDGHSHEVIPGPAYGDKVFTDKDGKEVGETMTGTKAANIGRMTISFADGAPVIRTELIARADAAAMVTTDAAKAAYDKVQAMIDQYNKDVDDYYGAVVGKSETTLYTNDPETGNRLVRNSETNLGDFVADAYRAITGADIAISNGGGLRAPINEGEITRKDLVNVNPFGNEIGAVEVTGQTILDALEHAARMYPQELGGFLHVSGMTYEINAAIESPVELDDTASFDHVNSSKPRRVRNVKVGGEPIDPEKTYTVGGTTYILQQGGDGMTMFIGSKMVFNPGMKDSDALISYVENELNGVIPAADYSELHGQGRISIYEETPGIVILHTNDIHCAIDGYSAFAGLKQQLIDEGNTVLLVDAGDAIQGEIIGLMTTGEAIVNLMNASGYDYAALGNHEFDYMVPRILELTDKAEYKYLAANFLDLATGESYYDAYDVVKINGRKIGFVGIATPETYTKSTPTYFMNEEGEFIYSFGEDDYYGRIQKAIDAARADGAEVIIAIGHTGLDGTEPAWNTRSVISNTSGINAYIDGHSHEVIPGPDYMGEIFTDKDGNEVAETMTGTKAAYIGKMTVSFDGDTPVITTGLLTRAEAKAAINTDTAKAQYDKVQAMIDGYNQQVDDYYGVAVGISETTLYTNDPETGKRMVRNSETNLGDFVADAYRTMLDADIAFANGGGLRAPINPGEITRKDLMNVNPFGNEMCMVEVTGQTILDALEHAARMYPQELGGFLHVSGMTYEINAFYDTPVVPDDTGSFGHINESMTRRVRNVKVNGEPIDPAKTYRLAGTTYILQQGGDGMTMFIGSKVISKPAMKDSDCLIAYVEGPLNGVIPAEGYSEVHGQGRITIYEKEDDFYTGFRNEAGENVEYFSGTAYWYENGERQGVYGDIKNVRDVNYGEIERGREIYDPITDAWYWLDADADGAVATDKEVWIPYIFQGIEDPEGKWVRYDSHGQMVKGWYANDNGVYYYDLITGAILKGTHEINGKTYTFDLLTGIRN